MNETELSLPPLPFVPDADGAVEGPGLFDADITSNRVVLADQDRVSVGSHLIDADLT